MDHGIRRIGSDVWVLPASPLHGNLVMLFPSAALLFLRPWHALAFFSIIASLSLLRVLSLRLFLLYLLLSLSSRLPSLKPSPLTCSLLLLRLRLLLAAHIAIHAGDPLVRPVLVHLDLHRLRRVARLKHTEQQRV